MKKQMMVGMLVLSTVVSFSAHAGPTAGPRSVREVIQDYMQKMDEYRASFRSGKVKPGALETVEARKRQDQTMDDLGLNRGEKASINNLITSGTAQKIDVVTSLDVLAAAKKGAQGKTDAESQSIVKYTDAAVKFMTNAELIGAKKSSDFLTESEFAEVSQAARRLVEMADRPTTYEKADLDSYANGLARANELAPRAGTFEEALVKGLMETGKDASGKTGVTKERALEIIRKINICKKRA